MEAYVASSWLDNESSMVVLSEAAKEPLDKWMIKGHTAAIAYASGENNRSTKEKEIITDLKGDDLTMFTLGKSVYERDGHCITCHQGDGKGLTASGFPPLAGAKWVTGDLERLIKVTLNGVYGPINVLGKDYPGQVPMTPFKGLLKDDEIAGVLTYIRNSFGNKASTVSEDQVKKIRAETVDKKGFYTPEELIKAHPFQ